MAALEQSVDKLAKRRAKKKWAPLLDGFGWLRKLPAGELEMIKDRFRDGDPVLLFQCLPKARNTPS
jgi:hypothetical protein